MFAINFYKIFIQLQGSTDNMSIVLVALAGAPQVSEAAQRDDKELDAKIEGLCQG